MDLGDAEVKALHADVFLQFVRLVEDRRLEAPVGMNRDPVSPFEASNHYSEASNHSSEGSTHCRSNH